MNPYTTYNNIRIPGIAEWGAFYDEDSDSIALMLKPEFHDQWIPADSHMSALYEGNARIYLTPSRKCYGANDVITMDDNKDYVTWPILHDAEWLNFKRMPTFGFPMDTIPCYSETDIELLEEQICRQRYTPQLVSPDQIQHEVAVAQAEAAMRPSLIPAEETKAKKKKNSIHININNTATNTAAKPKKHTSATAMVVPVPPDPIPSAPPMPSLPPAVVQTMIQHAIMTNAICPLTDVFIKDQQPHMIAVTSCGHVFYKPAIKKWIFRDPTCPCCQTYCQVHE